MYNIDYNYFLFNRFTKLFIYFVSVFYIQMYFNYNFDMKNSEMIFIISVCYVVLFYILDILYPNFNITVSNLIDK
jgi:hypothetical protein